MSLSSSSSEVSLPDSNSSWELLSKLSGGKGRDPSSVEVESEWCLGASCLIATG